MQPRLVDCTRAHANAILAILNEAILHSTALWDYEPRPPAAMDAWFAAKEQGGYPVIGLIDDDEALLGFGTYGPFRAWPAYKYTVEHSVYVHRDHRGRGLGRMLIAANLARAREQGPAPATRVRALRGGSPCRIQVRALARSRAVPAPARYAGGPSGRQSRTPSVTTSRRHAW